MNNMRKLINLMEGVMAVPGINTPINELSKDTLKSYSKGRSTDIRADVRDADSARELSGKKGDKWSDEADWLNKRAEKGAAGVARATTKIAAKESAPPGMEDVVLDLKKQYPDDHSKAFATAWSIYNKKHGKAEEGCTSMEEAHVDSCRQSNPATARDACAMNENSEYDLDFISQSIRSNYDIAASEEELKQMVAGETGYGQNPDFDNMFHSSLDHFLNGDDTSFDHMGPDDFSDDADALASAGHGSDEDYGGDDFPMEDLQNGYDDVEFASGNDFFPNGADGPVVTSVGPSGARHGDNPEQKKMQVAEVHKELVYGYRKFLKESVAPVQKKKLSESVQVSDLRMEDWGGDDHVSHDEATFDGGFSMSGKAMGRDGNVHSVGFDVSVKATAGIGWEEDEEPTGWNYKTDNPTYTSSVYATVGDVSILSVEFADGMEFIVDDDSLYLKDAMRLFDPNVLKQLLNPAVYEKLVGTLFDKKAENLDPPEQDYHEPERYDSRY